MDRALISGTKDCSINIIGQAPGPKTQEAALLKTRVEIIHGWGVDDLYHSGQFVVIPMDFYFPGHKVRDLPPRKGLRKSGTLNSSRSPDIELTP